MKALFVHSNKFWHYQGHYYSYGHYDYDQMWPRYLKYFDHIDCLGHVIETSNADDIKGLRQSDGPNVEIHDLAPHGTFSFVTHALAHRRLIRSLVDKVDAVIVRLPCTPSSLALEIARGAGKPCAAEVVTDCWASLWYHGRVLGKFAALPFMLLEKWSVRRASHVLYVSRHFLQDRYPNRHFNMGCPDCNIPPQPQDVLDRRLERIRSQAAVADRPFRLGLIGSLKIQYKGHETAIRALAIVAREFPNVKLCFLGDGDPAKWLALAESLQVRDNLEICGSLPGGEPVLQWLDNIDVYLQPSRQETLGRALIEAMSRGCPCLGSRETACPEQIADDCICPMFDYRQLAELILNLLRQPAYMVCCAQENFYRAHKYSEEILEPKRAKFWNRFVQDAAAKAARS